MKNSPRVIMASGLRGQSAGIFLTSGYITSVEDSSSTGSIFNEASVEEVKRVTHSSGHGRKKKVAQSGFEGLETSPSKAETEPGKLGRKSTTNFQKAVWEGGCLDGLVH